MEKSHNMELYFEEDDFDGFIAKWERRKDIEYIVGGVKEAGWGQRSVHFYDLNGHIIEVGENMKMVVERFLRFWVDDGGNFQTYGSFCCGFRDTLHS